MLTPRGGSAAGGGAGAAAPCAQSRRWVATHGFAYAADAARVLLAYDAAGGGGTGRVPPSGASSSERAGPGASASTVNLTAHGRATAAAQSLQQAWPTLPVALLRRAADELCALPWPRVRQLHRAAGRRNRYTRSEAQLATRCFMLNLAVVVLERSGFGTASCSTRGVAVAFVEEAGGRVLDWDLGLYLRFVSAAAGRGAARARAHAPHRARGFGVGVRRGAEAVESEAATVSWDLLLLGVVCVLALYSYYFKFTHKLNFARKQQQNKHKVQVR